MSCSNQKVINILGNPQHFFPNAMEARDLRYVTYVTFCPTIH